MIDHRREATHLPIERYRPRPTVGVALDQRVVGDVVGPVVGASPPPDEGQRGRSAIRLAALPASEKATAARRVDDPRSSQLGGGTLFAFTADPPAALRLLGGPSGRAVIDVDARLGGSTTQYDFESCSVGVKSDSIVGEGLPP